jgi:hypothetical protein
MLPKIWEQGSMNNEVPEKDAASLVEFLRIVKKKRGPPKRRATPPPPPGAHRLRPNLITFSWILPTRDLHLMRYIRTLVGFSLLTVALSAWCQLPERPHGSKSSSEPNTTGVATPELDSLGRSVAIQTRPDQVQYFQSAIESTDKALQESRQLQRLGPNARNIGLVNKMSLQLRDTLDDTEHYTGRLLASFTKVQTSELKKLTKRLEKSYSAVKHDARAVSDLMEPGKVVPEQLATGAANLEKSLSDYRSDQIRLGREMGIQSQ